MRKLTLLIVAAIVTACTGCSKTQILLWSDNNLDGKTFELYPLHEYDSVKHGFDEWWVFTADSFQVWQSRRQGDDTVLIYAEQNWKTGNPSPLMFPSADNPYKVVVPGTFIEYKKKTGYFYYEAGLFAMDGDQCNPIKP